MNSERRMVLPGDKIATSQNGASAKLNYPAGFYAMSKPELRKAYEDLNWENHQLKNGSKITQLEKEIKQLREESRKYYNESHHYKDKCLGLQEKLQAKSDPVEIIHLRLAV